MMALAAARCRALPRTVAASVSARWRVAAAGGRHYGIGGDAQTGAQPGRGPGAQTGTQGEAATRDVDDPTAARIAACPSPWEAGSASVWAPYLACTLAHLDASGAPAVAVEAATRTAGLRFPVCIIPDFVSQEEEEALMADATPHLQRRRYERSHWDEVITGYRETRIPLAQLSVTCQAVAQRVVATFPAAAARRAMNSVHVLDLLEEGYIGRHVDSVKFSGDVIAGISLLTDSVMNLYNPPLHTTDAPRPAPLHTRAADTSQSQQPAEPHGHSRVRLHLPRRSLYILTGVARYEWDHEVPRGGSAQQVEFKEHRIIRTRRVSFIFRDETP